MRQGTSIAQSGPVCPGEQWHCPALHTPADEQPLGHGVATSHAMVEGGACSDEEEPFSDLDEDDAAPRGPVDWTSLLGPWGPVRQNDFADPRLRCHECSGMMQHAKCR